MGTSSVWNGAKYDGQYAFSWVSGKMINLGRGIAFGINAAGQIVGTNDGVQSSTPLTGVRGSALLFSASGGTPTDLGTLGGHYATAQAINDSGQIVGTSTRAGDYGQFAFLYSGGKMTDLGALLEAVPLLGALYSAATSINASGEVVGQFSGGNVGRSFLYSGGVMRELNSLLPADSRWYSLQARAINNAGQIVGIGRPSENDYERVFLLDTKAAATYIISGQIANLTYGVTVSLTGSQTVSISTDGDGKYLLRDLALGGNYTITPSRTGYSFTPASVTFSPLTGSQMANFVASNFQPNAPVITPGGIGPLFSSATTIQAGSWVSIYGSNLASGTATWNSDFPKSLGGTSVTINNKPCFLWYVSPGQINLQTPDDSATGTVSLVITTPNGNSASQVTLGQAGPSFSVLDGKHVAGIILRTDGSGAYGGGVYDILGPTGTSLGYKTTAAKAGDTVELFGIGFGPTDPAVPAGKPFSGAAATTNIVQLRINNVVIDPAFSGMTSAGLYQFNIVHLPAGLGSGDVTLQASVVGTQTPPVVISLQ